LDLSLVVVGIDAYCGIFDASDHCLVPQVIVGAGEFLRRRNTGALRSRGWLRLGVLRRRFDDGSRQLFRLVYVFRLVHLFRLIHSGLVDVF
jgi:hypothetical protein